MKSMVLVVSVLWSTVAWSAPPLRARAGKYGVPFILADAPLGRGGDWTGTNRCAPTCTAMLLRAHKLPHLANQSDSTLIYNADLADGNLNKVSPIDSAIGVLRLAGLETRWKKGPDAQWIKTHLEQGHKLVVAGNPNALPWSTVRTDGPGESGHSVTIVGLTKDGKFVVHDPHTPTNKPELLDAAELHRFQALFAPGHKAGDLTSQAVSVATWKEPKISKVKKSAAAPTE